MKKSGRLRSADFGSKLTNAGFTQPSGSVPSPLARTEPSNSLCLTELSMWDVDYTSDISHTVPVALICQWWMVFRFWFGNHHLDTITTVTALSKQSAVTVLIRLRTNIKVVYLVVSLLAHCRFLVWERPLSHVGFTRPSSGHNAVPDDLKCLDRTISIMIRWSQEMWITPQLFCNTVSFALVRSLWSDYPFLFTNQSISWRHHDDITRLMKKLI